MRIIDRLVGGPTRNVVHLTRGLDPQRFDTLLVAGWPAEGEPGDEQFARAAGVQPLRIPELSREIGWQDAAVLVRLVREMFRFRPDIIHTHKSKAGATGRVAAMIYRWATPGALLLRPRPCRVLHTFHGHVFHSYYGPWKTRLFITIERLLGRFCTDRIVTVSEQQRREICERFRIARPEQFEVVPLGLDFESAAGVPGRFRNEFQIRDDEFLVAAVGRLTEVKNYSMFLKACAAALQLAPEVNFRFALVGDGHLRPALAAEAAALGIAGRVLFTGMRDDVSNVYLDSDLVALSSLNEGTPLALLEGMSFGKPVLATEVGGVVDLLGAPCDAQRGVRRWEHGFSVPSNDAGAFAAGLASLARTSPQERRAMGERGQKFVLANYSKQRLVSDIEALYERLLS